MRITRTTKVGHGGTLDPFATGVLLVLVGKATRFCEVVMGMPKAYETTIKLGATTATDDPDSPEIMRPDASPPSRDRVEELLKSFIGTIEQRPPTYSAVKIGGLRASDHARRGDVVQPQARTVHIHTIDCIHYEWPLLNIRIECGRGTYIRALARDLGEKLGVGGYVTALRRTRVGPYDIAAAVRLDDLTIQNLHEHIHAPPERK